MQRRWFYKFLTTSVSLRKGRVIIALVSVTLAVSLITGMVGITSGIARKLGSNLTSYGANIIIAPLDQDYIDIGVLTDISNLDNVEDVSGHIYGNTVINGHSIEVIGLDIDGLKKRHWRLSGRWPEQRGEVLVGTALAGALHAEPGASLSILQNQTQKEFTITGFIEKGGAEDNAIIMAMEDAWELLARQGKLSSILVRAETLNIQNAIIAISAALPRTMVKTRRQVAEPEMALLNKIQLLMALVTAVVVLAAGISVAGTVGANVFERREEIGLMKALGATNSQIRVFYHAETALIGIAGGIAGLIAGCLVAQIISHAAFQSFLSIPPFVTFIAIATGPALSMAAGVFPVEDAIKRNPAVILRGE